MASFGSALNTYYAVSRCITRRILRVVFFVTRGALTNIIKDNIRALVDTIHKMLRLAKDQVLILQGHPLLGEYQVPSSDRPLRFFPTESSCDYCATYAGLLVHSVPRSQGKTRIANLLDHTSLGDAQTLFYLQGKSSSGGCLGTQPVVAGIFPRGRALSRLTNLCRSTFSLPYCST